jgi:hypothetical protein
MDYARPKPRSASNNLESREGYGRDTRTDADITDEWLSSSPSRPPFGPSSGDVPCAQIHSWTVTHPAERSIYPENNLERPLLLVHDVFDGTLI